MAPWTITIGRSRDQAETDDAASDYVKRIEEKWAIMIPESCILSPHRISLIMKRTGDGIWNVTTQERVVLLKSTCYQDTRLGLSSFVALRSRTDIVLRVSSLVGKVEQPLITISSKLGPPLKAIVGAQDCAYIINDIDGNLIAETICNLPPQRKILASKRKATVYFQSRSDPACMSSLLMERLARWVTIRTPEGVIVAIVSVWALQDCSAL